MSRQFCVKDSAYSFTAKMVRMCENKADRNDQICQQKRSLAIAANHAESAFRTPYRKPQSVRSKQ